ncbi:MAG: zinc dependent phospholipase C family protein [Deltaproteobacteria bacterium]
MPKELTHWILAEEAFSRLEGESRTGTIIREHHEMYLAGAVLPDTLLHLFHGPHARVALTLADSFHDSPGNSNEPLVKVEEQFPCGLPPHILACLMGVISHMQADIVFHPFVYAVTGTDLGEHYRLETTIDLCLLQAGAVTPAWHLSELVTPQVRENLLDVCSLLFDPGKELPDSAVSHALDLHCRYQAMYDHSFWQLAATIRGCLPVPKYRRQQHLFYPLNLFGKKYEVDNEGRWCCPVTGEQRKETLSDLANSALKRTLELFQLIERYGSLKTALNGVQGENLLTGLHGIRKSSIKASPAIGSKAAA